MIVVDIETTGNHFSRCSVIEVGAVDLETGEEFWQEARMDDGDIIFSDGAIKIPLLDVLGKTEEELRDTSKQSSEQLIRNFFNWVKKRGVRNFVCQNPAFDVAFLSEKAKKYGMEPPFHYRSFDLHSMAQMKYFELNGSFLFKSEVLGGISGMSLSDSLKYVGIGDPRDIVHNALEDAKLTAECFSRLVYGKNMIQEYEKYPIPEYLK